jgi:phosphate starvation-inducible PhoH-like protein
MLEMQRRGDKINRSRIRYAVDLAKEGNADMIEKIMGDVVAITCRGRQVKCKTLGQKRYVQALKEFELVFGIGPPEQARRILRSQWRCCV